MKKFVCVLMVLIFALGLSACSGDVVAIEDYEWKMGAVMRNDIEVAQNEDELVVAVGEEDDIHPNAKIVDLKLVAKDGSITVTDATNNKTYSGTYKVQQKTPKGTDYEVTIDGIKGYATVAPTEYYDGSEVPTLPINLEEFSLYFTPVE
uniref:hypothetical protein n=1 Tax=Agathobacter sp. TaxID=2021311 RepID=UPI004055D491